MELIKGGLEAVELINTCLFEKLLRYLLGKAVIPKNLFVLMSAMRVVDLWLNKILLHWFEVIRS